MGNQLARPNAGSGGRVINSENMPVDPPVPEPETPQFKYSSDGKHGEHDLDAQAEHVINAHIADLEFHDEPLDDDDEIIHYSTVIPGANNGAAQMSDQVEVRRSIMPAKRRKLLNLRYLTRLRGLVKVLQTLWAVMLMNAVSFDQILEYPTQRITLNVCPFLIVFNFLIINGYVAFPHLTIKEGATRNGMLFSELLVCTTFGIYFVAIAPFRGIEIILSHFNLDSLLITAIFQGPLTVLVLYDLFGCFGEWSLVGMRPLGQRVGPKNVQNEPAGAYANSAYDPERGHTTPGGETQP